MKITQIEPLAYHCHLIKVQLILAIVSVAQFVQLFVTLWIAARQAPLSMEFSRHEYWSGLPFPSLEDLPDRPRDQTCVSCIRGRFFTAEPAGKPPK